MYTFITQVKNELLTSFQNYLVPHTKVAHILTTIPQTLDDFINNAPGMKLDYTEKVYENLL